MVGSSVAVGRRGPVLLGVPGWTGGLPGGVEDRGALGTSGKRPGRALEGAAESGLVRVGRRAAHRGEGVRVIGPVPGFGPSGTEDVELAERSLRGCLNLSNLGLPAGRRCTAAT
ncbi:hypothetical protein NDU88_006783 [Pleurodeles waltl]|uniref:Uncharacterized protein n=1 Tax=Pleurodeles waltl TaxID=8319 RepID=A0AAV7NV09_PLEWA|nr:hypothetical protein NDU88_006783 [Pleurodeles waltl]